MGIDPVSSAGLGSVASHWEVFKFDHMRLAALLRTCVCVFCL